MKSQRLFTFILIILLFTACFFLLAPIATAQDGDIPESFTVTITTESDETLEITVVVKQTKNGFKLVPKDVYNPDTHTFHGTSLSLPDDVPHSNSWGGIIVDEETIRNILSGEITLTGSLGPSRGSDSGGSGGGNSSGGGSGGGGEGGN